MCVFFSHNSEQHITVSLFFYFLFSRCVQKIRYSYIGAEQGVLSGCHNDALNMLEYIKDVHGFDDSNITILLDDGKHESPTKENIINAYKKLVEQSEPGYDETLVPVDYNSAGMIRDDDLYNILIKPLPENVHLFCLFDCCHSGTVLDLPYIFKADGEQTEMEIDEKFDFKKLLGKFDTVVDDVEGYLGKLDSDDAGGLVGKVQGFLSKF
jgi:metacaspase-1